MSASVLNTVENTATQVELAVPKLGFSFLLLHIFPMGKSLNFSGLQVLHLKIDFKIATWVPVKFKLRHNQEKGSVTCTCTNIWVVIMENGNS